MNDTVDNARIELKETTDERYWLTVTVSPEDGSEFKIRLQLEQSDGVTLSDGLRTLNRMLAEHNEMKQQHKDYH